MPDSPKKKCPLVGGDNPAYPWHASVTKLYDNENKLSQRRRRRRRKQQQQHTKEKTHREQARCRWRDCTHTHTDSTTRSNNLGVRVSSRNGVHYIALGENVRCVLVVGLYPKLLSGLANIAPPHTKGRLQEEEEEKGAILARQGAGKNLNDECDKLQTHAKGVGSREDWDSELG